MSTQPTIPPVDPAWGLPAAPTRSCSLTGPTFARLLAAAKEGGWPAVWTLWAEGETYEDTDGHGNTHHRPRRRRTLVDILRRRADLRAILEEAAQEKRDRLLKSLESEAERIALGPPDTATDFDKQGRVTRVRTDSRNKLRAIEQLLKANDRDKYGDHKRVDHTGSIDHHHAHAHLLTVQPGVFTIKPDEVFALPPERATLLLELLDELSMLKERNHDDERSIEPVREGVRALPPSQRTDGAGEDEGEAGPASDR